MPPCKQAAGTRPAGGARSSGSVRAAGAAGTMSKLKGAVGAVVAANKMGGEVI